MTEDKTSSKSKSDTTRIITLGVVSSLIAVAIAGILSPVFPYLNETVKLPVWGYLTFVVVFFVIVIWTVVFFRQQLKREVVDYEETLALWEKAQTDWNRILEEHDQEHEKEIQDWVRAQESWQKAKTVLEATLTDERQMVPFEGFYYRGTDAERKNPFCRVCWEGDKRLTSVVNLWNDDRNGRGYYCDYCEKSYALPSLPEPAPVVEEELDGEDIPF